MRLADELKVMCGVAERPLQLAEDHDRAVEADHEILGSPIGSAHFFNMSDRADGPSDRVEPRGAPDTVSCAEVRPGNSHACSAGVQRSCAGCGATERIAPAGAGAYRAEAHLNGGWHLLRCCGPAGKTSELGPEVLRGNAVSLRDPSFAAFATRPIRFHSARRSRFFEYAAIARAHYAGRAVPPQRCSLTLRRYDGFAAGLAVFARLTYCARRFFLACSSMCLAWAAD